MRIGGRDLRTIALACLERRHYVAALNMLRTYKQPVELFGRYLLDRGDYPSIVRVRTPTGPLDLDVYTSHDVLTLNEIFCRVDYPANDQSVFVDFGSNIGISAAYFLSRNRHAFAYLYEPLPMNLERLRKNLQPFDGRYVLNAVAVGPSEGTVEFGWENTGRYGGVGLQSSQQIQVRCVDSNAVLEQVIQKHGKIDVLKIDIETLELAVTERIPRDLALRIGNIYVEYQFKSNPLWATHTFIQRGSVAQFVSLRRN